MTNLILQVIAALCVVESGYNTNAVGDGGRAVGVLQMWPVAVAEANRLAKHDWSLTEDYWTLDDRRDMSKSWAMCFITLKHQYMHGVTNPVALGGRWRNPNGNAPEWYLKRVSNTLEKVAQ